MAKKPTFPKEMHVAFVDDDDNDYFVADVDLASCGDGERVARYQLVETGVVKQHGATFAPDKKRKAPK